MATLHGVIEDLRTLNQNTENNFLEIGGKLLDFLQTAESMAAGLNSLTILISGEHGRHASTLLTRALLRCGQMQTRAAERSKELEMLREGAASVRNTFSAFRDFLVTFRLVCTLTRIETARLGGVGSEVRSQTDDVKSLAESMGSKAERILGAAIRLDEEIEATVVRLLNGNVLLVDLPAVITGVMNDLGSFSNQQQEAAALSGRLAIISNSASSSIKDAVTSIQFHDITRQQVEHVIEALEYIRSKCKNAGANVSHQAAAVLALESEQLSAAESAFSSSVQHLSRDLDNIAGCVREMATNGRVLLDASGGEQTSFFRNMEHCLGAILSATGTYDNADLATIAATAELNLTLETIRETAGEIGDIAFQLHRVALNARITATQMGAKGAPLSVLALALKDLATDSRHRSGAVAEALDSMTAVVSRLSTQSESSTRAEMLAEEDAVGRDMRSTIEELHSSSEVSFFRMREITAMATRLCEEISTVQGGFVAGELFSNAVPKCRRQLMQLVAEAEPASAEEDLGDVSLVLGDFARSYTMRAERDVHTAATRTAAALPGLSDSGKVIASQTPAEDLGDNFELF